MKICILGDTHFGVKSDSAVFHDYYEKFYSTVLFPYLEAQGINLIVQVGDLFDKEKTVNFYTFNRAKQYFFDPMVKKGIKMITLVGNHDKYYKNSVEINAQTQLLTSYKNIKIVDTFETILGIDMIPWICDDNYDQIMESIKESKSTLLFGHLELAGFQMQKGSLMEKGMSPDIFNKYDMVISGHYHHRSTGKNITYVGIPYEMTWADWDDPKGYHIFDTDTRELTFSRNPYSIYHKIIYNDSNKNREQVLDINYEQYRDCYIKLIIDQQNNQSWLDEFVHGLESVARDVKTIDHAIVFSSKEEVLEVDDTDYLIKKSVEELDTSANKDDVSDYLMKLYVRAVHNEKL